MQPLIIPQIGPDELSVTPTNGNGNAISIPAFVKNTQLRAWVRAMAALCQPDRIQWCDGSPQEYAALCEELVQSGTFIKLNAAKRPNSFLARSDPSDVARVRGSHLHL
jgi:phosphoenolpyruvate carboxykinase (GTP)